MANNSDATEFVRDGNGQLIGQIQGKWAKAKNGKMLGYFNESINRTVTMDGKIFGMGDQRKALIYANK